MDAESLAQIEQIVTTAVTGVEGRLRSEMQALREELGEKIEAAERHTDEKFAVAERLSDERIAAAERHSGVLYEDVLHRIDLVVEGHQALHQKIEGLEARLEHEFLETRSLIKLSTASSKTG